MSSQFNRITIEQYDEDNFGISINGGNLMGLSKHQASMILEAIFMLRLPSRNVS